MAAHVAANLPLDLRASDASSSRCRRSRRGAAGAGSIPPASCARRWRARLDLPVDACLVRRDRAGRQVGATRAVRRRRDRMRIELRAPAPAGRAARRRRPHDRRDARRLRPRAPRRGLRGGGRGHLRPDALSPGPSPAGRGRHAVPSIAMSLLRDYSNQARTYDETRAASPSVLEPLREALAGAPGRRLADIGGGTGNYARALRDEGWEPVVIDREPAMLAQAAAKGLETTRGRRAAAAAGGRERGRGDARVDAPPRRGPRGGGRRGPAGPAPGRPARADGLHARGHRRRAGCRTTSRARAHGCSSRTRRSTSCWRWCPAPRHLEVRFRDLEDGSLAALSAYPEKIVEPEWHRQTSFFERLARDHPDELAAGLARIRAELAEGTAPNEPGLASVIAWGKPR